MEPADIDPAVAEQADSSISYAHIFTPLKKQNEIRLLTIFPGPKEDPIRCTLNKATLDPVPRYDALSYVWGTVTSQAAIYVNDHPIYIRRSLWHFLLALRHLNEERVVWVDAICISQSDLEEKARQVQQIGKIFSKARAVRSWLGDEAAGGFPLWKDGRFEIASNLEYFTTGRLSFIDPVKKFKTWEGFTGSLDVVLEDIARSPYWGRTWIVQEIVAAQRLLLCSAGEVIRWSDFMHVIGQMLADRLSRRRPARLHTTRDWFEQQVQYIQKLDSQRREFQSDYNKKPTRELSQLSDGNILRLVQAFLSTECFDPRDKIYALLFLAARPGDDSGISADYIVSPAVLYLRTLHVSKPIKAAQQAENLRISMKILWSDIVAVPSDDVWHEGWRRFDDIEPSKYLDGDIIRAKLRYVGRVYDLLQLRSATSTVTEPDNDGEVTVFRNILPSSSSFTVFHTRGAVGLDEELWQVALSPTTLICRPFASQGARHCTGVALISSNEVYSRPASADSIFSLPDFEPFKHAQFKLDDDHPPIPELPDQDASRTWAGTAGLSSDYSEEALYNEQNAGFESVLLSSEAWRIVCTHWYKDPDVGIYFAE